MLPRRRGCAVSLLASAGLDTVAVRVPAQEMALALLRATGRPVAAPSANRSGQVSPTTAQHVLDELSGRIAAVLDSGAVSRWAWNPPCSTCRPPSPFCCGQVARRSRRSKRSSVLFGACDHCNRRGAPRSPGLLASHYAPKLPVRLDAVDVQRDEALLAFGPPLAGAGAVFGLSDAADLTEAAARLFAGLRKLDETPARGGLSGSR